MREQFFSIAIASIALLAMVGWWTDRPTMTSICDYMGPMQFNTALSFFECCIGLYFVTVRKPRFVIPFGVLSASIGLLTVTQDLTGVDLGIDQVLWGSSGRMSPPTAVAFIFTGLSLLTWRHHLKMATMFAFAPLIIALLVLYGYFFNVEHLYHFGIYTDTAINTAVAFLLYGVGFIYNACSQNIDEALEACQQNCRQLAKERKRGNN